MQTAPRARVFLTGATGTVGGGILEALSADGGYEVTCLVRRPEAASEIKRHGAHPVIGDMADESLFLSVRESREFEFIIHAAQAHTGNHAQAVIDRLERRAVRNCELLGSGATRLMIFTGGVWSYGTGGAGHPINERTPLRPFSAAHERVRLVQELVHQRAFPWLIVDPPSMVYGPVGPIQAVDRALRGGATIEILDDDHVLWSVVDRLDLGRAYLSLLQEGRPGEMFVVAEDAPVSVPAFYETVARFSGAGRIVRQPLSFFARETPDELERRRTSQPVDSSYLKARTGWQARENFPTSVGKFLPAK